MEDSTTRFRILAALGLLIFFFALSHYNRQHPFTRPQESNIINPCNIQIVSSTCLPDSHRNPPTRAHTATITDYGGVGDGLTLNTGAFERAMAGLGKIDGGAELHVPAGHWLTGCFNLTSHLTIYLERGAVILGSQSPQDWPLIDALPSYGRGRERPGRRHSSLFHGEDLVDVWITGENGTIDGQGSIWWDMWRNRSLEHTRGHLVEFISSQAIVISNVVLRNSPFWTLHPVYCNNVVVKNVTILAPWNAPNTDGIDPDSSSNVCIEDCYISNGDDLISIKSGWDEYGRKTARPSVNITVRRVTGTTRTCSGIALGSEVSGGIAHVTVEDVHVFDSAAGIRLKTAPGRGGYVTNVTISGMTLTGVKRAIEFSGDAGEHPHEGGGPNYYSTMSLVKGIVIKNIVGTQIMSPGRFVSVLRAPFQDICLFNISLDAVSPTWSCSHAHGSSSSVSPPLCPQLRNSNLNTSCNFSR